MNNAILLSNFRSGSNAGKRPRYHARRLRQVVSLGLLGLAATIAAYAQQIAYVSNSGEDNVSVIDIATNAVVTTVVVGAGPGKIAITPDSSRAYVTSQGTNSVAVIDLATNTVTTAIPVGSNPFGIGITPDGATAYIVNTSSDDVTVIDTTTNTVVATVPVGNGPEDVAFTPDGTRAYIANTQSSSQFVSIIDVATNTVTDTVAIGAAPVCVAITPNGERAYVTTGSGHVTVLDTTTNAITGTIPVGGNLSCLAITPDGSFAYVADGATDIVAVIDITTNTVADVLSVGGYKFGVAISPDGAFAYVTSAESESYVSVIDTATNTLVATINVGNSPIAVAIAELGMTGDTDGDGIEDSVDLTPGMFSDAFSDSDGTSGSIANRAGLPVLIEDATSPDGVRVVVGAGSGQVTLDACGFIETVAAGSEAIITCGSVKLEVIEGAAQVLLDATGSAVSIPAGVTALVASNSDGTVLIQNVAGDGMLSVTVHGEQSTLGPNQSASYTVEYQFAGFFNPVDNPPVLNSAKGGGAIPVKFSLGGDHGLHVLASGYPKSQKIACDTSAPLDPVEETVAAAASSLSYDATADQYIYVWKTDKTWAGTCRQLTLKLNDSSAYAAHFKFK